MIDNGGNREETVAKQRGPADGRAHRLVDSVGRPVLTLLLVLGGVAIAGRLFFGPSTLESAYEACKERHTMVSISVGDDGSSIGVNGVGAENENMTEEYRLRTLAGFGCLLDELEVSDALRQDLNGTTAMMGRQTATEDGLTYAWSYHPDTGVQMTIREE